MMNGEPAPISAKERSAIEQELSEVRAGRDRIAATLSDADPAGDSADQADKLQRVTELENLETRIRDLTSRLSESHAAGPPRTDLVDVGSTVTVRFFDGETETIQIGEITESLDQTLVTADSPLGRALLGGRPGDTVRYDTPSGQASATVLSIGA